MNVRRLSVVALVAAVVVPSLRAQATDAERLRLDLTEIRRVPVLDNGRFKPFDSYAREFVTRMSGEFRPKVLDAAGAELPKRDPVHVYLEWIFDRDAALTRRNILLGEATVQRALGVEARTPADRFASYESLATNAKLEALVRKLRTVPADRWSPEEREVMNLQRRRLEFGDETALAAGGEIVHGPPFVPPPGPKRPGETYAWVPVAGVGSFPAYTDAQKNAVRDAYANLGKAFLAADGAAFDAAARALNAAVEALKSPEHPDPARLEREIVFNRVRPFETATWWYFGSFFLAVVAVVVRRRALDVAAALPALGGLGYHVYGLHERTWLSGRALIGTFFESMLFVSAAALVFGLVFEAIFRRRWFLLSGAFLAFLGLWGALVDPQFMQPAIGNLPPVLINNFWIHIHVPVIMASYAMVALSWMMGHVWLGMRLAKSDAHPEMKELSRIQYWVLPPALILVFAGTVLGGVWADAAWGRFWGWDPKEIGAFVLMVAVAVVVHGRYAGWLKDFGTAVGTVASGFALFVSYYGVNFFSSGLHSYTSTSAADLERSFFERVPAWVYVYLVAEIALVAAVAAKVRREAARA